MTNNIKTSLYEAEENTYLPYYIYEEKYFDTMSSKVIPFISSFEESGYINGENNIKIYYRKYILDNPKGNIVISHGFTECIEKYSELIYYFLNEGFSVFIHEHRGHGRSGVLGQIDSSQVSIEDYHYYILDFKSFLDNIVVPNSKNQNLILFAHSMGGGIAARFLEEYNDYFSKAILSSPMLEINTGSTHAFIAKSLTRLMVKKKKSGNYVLGQGPYIDSYQYETAGTTCKARYDYFYHIQSNNNELQRGGASYHWLAESFKLSKDAVNAAAEIKIPLLLFQAEHDDFVKPSGQNIFAGKLSNCTLIKVAGSKHDIFREKDEILIPYMEKIISFIN